MKKIFFVLFFSIVLSSPFFADDETVVPAGEISADENILRPDPDSVESDGITFPENSVSLDDEKHYFTALTGTALTWCVIGGWNRFVSRADWAKVSISDCKFWEKSMEFDRDWYWTNFVLHPYQGGLYYMAARNSNLNVLESFVVATFGSFVWEYMWETNTPSINDNVYSGVGGFIMGEMFYRLSLEGRKDGSSAGRKFLGYLCNPLELYTNPMTGHAPYGQYGCIYDFSLKTGFTSATSRTWLSSSKYDYPETEAFPASCLFEFEIVYNDPYGHDSNDPYSQFELQFGGGAGVGSGEGVKDIEQKLMYDIHLFSNGMLFARAPDCSDSRDLTVGASINYDFIWNSFIELATIEVGPCVKNRKRYENSKLEYQYHLGWVLLSTTDNYFLLRNIFPKPDGVYSDYGYGTGAEVVQKYRFETNGGFVLDWSLHEYLLYTLEAQKQEFSNGYSDDTGWTNITFVDLSLEKYLTKSVSVGISDEFYWKTVLNDNYPYVNSIHNTVGIYARINLVK